jgi:hypothetical protein
MPSIEFEVTGIPETVAAFDKLDRLDYSKAANAAGRAVLPAVRERTRHDTGAMQGAWNVEGEAFINNEVYSSYQEFGTRYVPATLAVFTAWESEQQAVIREFEEHIEDAASQIGFDT